MDIETSIPKVLYHGTSHYGLEGIKNDNAMFAADKGDELAISFTTDWNTATRFARWSEQNEGTSQSGIIIEFDGIKLAQAHALEPFSDSSLITHESEWRIKNGYLPNAEQFIVDVENLDENE